MQYILASDPLATGGQIAAIILLIYMFIYTLVGLALALALMFSLGWVREKSELVKKLRPMVDSVNTTSEAVIKGTLSAAGPNDNKIVRTVANVVAEVPKRAHTIDQKVEQGSDRVANAVIEFHARTVMAQSILKAFFLPGLTKRQLLKEKELDFKSPGYRMLMEQMAPEVPAEPGAGYVVTVKSTELKDASVR